MSIKKAIEHGLCMGCGTCKLVLKDKVDIKLNDYGFYHAQVNVGTDLSLASNLCPFSNDSLNETQVSKYLYNDKLSYDSRVGYFSNIYAGSIQDIESKMNSSSGGLTTWFIKKLIKNKEVDAVIHVGANEKESNLFEYKISNSLEEVELRGNKKSRYYPVSLETIIEKVEKSDKKFVFVGIPCYVKSIRLAQKAGYLENIKFCISLLCGHMKSAAFAENLAWQVGVSPKNLKSIDFRVKSPKYNADKYLIEVITDDDKKILEQNFELFGSNWGHGFFKHKACDFCDDLSGELADVTFGDAWLPKYVSDYQGTNIVISRSNLFDRYLKKYHDELDIDHLTVDDFVESQAANYRHRRDGLKSRIENTKGWLPVKRLDLYKNKISKKRERIYSYRYYLSQRSNEAFLLAKKKNDYRYFKLIMYPLIINYMFKLNGYKSGFKSLLRVIFPTSIIKILKGRSDR